MKLTIATLLVTALLIADVMNGTEAGQSQRQGSLSATRPLDSWIRWFMNRSKQFEKHQTVNGKPDIGILPPNRIDGDDFSVEDFDDVILPESLHSESKRQHDDYGHMRYGKRDFDDYGHMRFGR